MKGVTTRIEASCRACAATATWTGVWQPSRLKRMRSQARIWMDTHYAQVDHHRFHLEVATGEEMSVARVRGDQLRFVDDPLYEPLVLGGDDA